MGFMRPILLKGHERSITSVRYNIDGDLLFTTSKDDKVCVWSADDGERLGTYHGHNGAVWQVDVSWDSKYLISGSADSTARIWDVETGVELATIKENAPVRAVAFSYGSQQCLTVNDPFMGADAFISVYDMPREGASLETHKWTPRFQCRASNSHGRINHAQWGPNNDSIISAGEDGFIRVWSSHSGELIESYTQNDPPKSINALQFSQDMGLFITASTDFTAKIFDSNTFECKKTFRTERPVNAAAISPTMPHVVLGGGQEAAAVTTTATRIGKFETRFFHMVFEDEIGQVKGHFGPINAVAFNPDGRSYVSGAEDGYVRLHHFDGAYFKLRDEVLP